MNFYSFISIAVEAEAKLEEIRILLGSYQTFEPFSAFKRFDQLRTGGLKHESIVEFLTDNQMQFTDEELNYMFRFFDQDQDGTIIYEEFKNCILPKLNDQVKNQILHHKGYDIPVGMLLPQEVERELAEFFLQLQKNYQSFQQIEEKINLNQLDIYDNDNSITIKSLQNWLKSIQQQIHDQILERFVLMINGNQQELQNLLEQIYQYEYKIQEEEEEQVVEYHKNQEELLEVGANQSNIPVPENTEQEVEEQPQQQEQQIQTQEDNQDLDESDNNLRELESIERDILSECQKIRRTLRSLSQQQSIKPIVLPILDKQIDDRTCQSIYYQTTNTIQSNRTYFSNYSQLQNPIDKDLIRINKEIENEKNKCDQIQILLEINQSKKQQLYFSNYSKVSGNSSNLQYSTPSKNNYIQKLQQMSGSKISRTNKNQYRPAFFNLDYWNSSKGSKKY